MSPPKRIDSRVKVMIQLNQLGYGGTEKSVLTLLRHVDLNRFLVQICLTSGRGSWRYFKYKFLRLFSRRYANGYHERWVTAYARFNDFQRLANGGLTEVSGWGGFKKAVDTFKPHLIHFNRGVGSEFYLLKLSELKEVNPAFIETSVFGVGAPPAYLEKLSHVFFVSDWLMSKATWATALPSSRLYNPVALLDHEGIRDRAVFKALGVKRERITIGRLTRPNLDNGEFVLRIVAPLLAVHSNLVFHSLGSSESFIRATLDEPRIVHFQPTTDEESVIGFLTELDVLLHYRAEGETFGLNVAEAMALGLPVVSHRSAIDNAQIELLTKYGQAGLVVDDMTSPVEFQEKLTQLIHSRALRESLGQTGARVAQTHFLPNNIAQQLQSTWRKAAEI